MLTIYSKRNTIVNKGWFIISFSSNRPLSFKVTPSETDKRNTHLILNTNKNLKVNLITLNTSYSKFKYVKVAFKGIKGEKC